MANEVGAKLRIGAIDRISRVLKRATKGLNGLKNATRRASNAFKGFQEKTAGIRSRLGKIGSSMKNIGTGLITKVTAPIIGLGVGIIGTAAKFQSAMNEVQAKTTFTGKTFDQLREQAKKMGAQSTFSATEAAKAQAFLAKAGFKSGQIFDALPHVLNLAAASQLDLATASDITSNIMGAFNIKSKDTERVANVLARATAGANVDMVQLGETFKQAGPVAHKFGASLEDAAAAAGLLGNIGIQGSAAGTALKNAFLGLSAPSSKARKLLEELGVGVVDPVSKKMLGFADIMKNLGGKLKDMPKDAQLKILKEIFGKIGIAGGSALAEFARTGGLEKFTDQLSDTTVTAKLMAKIMNKGAKGAMKSLGSAFEGLALAIADSGILETFTKILLGEKEDGKGGIVGFVRWLGKLAKENPTIVQLATTFAIFAAAMGPVIFVIGAFVAILPGLISLAGILGITIGALAIKFILIGALVIGLVAAGFFLIKHWDRVKVFMLEMWTKISNFLDSKIGIVLQILLPFIGIPFQIIKNWEVISGFFVKLWNDVDSSFHISEAWDEFFKPDIESSGWDALPKFFERLWAKIKAIFTNSIVAVKKSVNDFLNLNKIGKELGIDLALGTDDKPETEETEEKEPGFFDNIFGDKKGPPAAAGATKNKSVITVDFKNLPTGTDINTNSSDGDTFNINTGLQGAAL